MVLISIGLVVQVLFDPLQWGINVVQIVRYRIELPMAMARWEKAGVTGYQIEVRGGYPLECTVTARLIVREGEGIEAQELPRFPSPAPQVLVGTATGWPDCQAQDYTVPQVLDYLDEVIRSVDPSFTQVKISFDRQYGYVRWFEINSGYRLGLLTPGVGDCCSRFDFENFEALK